MMSGRVVNRASWPTDRDIQVNAVRICIRAAMMSSNLLRCTHAIKLVGHAGALSLSSLPWSTKSASQVPGPGDHWSERPPPPPARWHWPKCYPYSDLELCSIYPKGLYIYIVYIVYILLRPKYPRSSYYISTWTLSDTCTQVQGDSGCRIQGVAALGWPGSSSHTL